jgi:hypothetical protein
MEWRIVLDLLQEMLQRDLSPDAISFGAGISACTLGTEKKHQHTGSSSQRCMCDATAVGPQWPSGGAATLAQSFLGQLQLQVDSTISHRLRLRKRE